MPQQNIPLNPDKGYYAAPTITYETLSPYVGLTIFVVFALIIMRVRYLAKRDKYRNMELPTEHYHKKKVEHK